MNSDFSTSEIIHKTELFQWVEVTRFERLILQSVQNGRQQEKSLNHGLNKNRRCRLTPR